MSERDPMREALTESFQSLTEELDEVRAERDALADALRELVRLKDGPRNDLYYAEREAAWQAARAALDRHTHQDKAVT